MKRKETADMECLYQLYLIDKAMNATKDYHIDSKHEVSEICFNMRLL